MEATQPGATPGQKQIRVTMMGCLAVVGVAAILIVFFAALLARDRDVTRRGLKVVDSQITSVERMPPSIVIKATLDGQQHIAANAGDVIEKVGRGIQAGAPEYDASIEWVQFQFNAVLVNRLGQEEEADVLSVTVSARDLATANFDNVITGLDLASDIKPGTGPLGWSVIDDWCAEFPVELTPRVCRETGPPRP